MLEQAARELGLSISECWMIGDQAIDITAGKNAGCRTVHLLTGKDEPVAYADFVAIDMVQAAEYILSHNKNK
jgi:D-glycero-D-manno-heptose 1,7-bisphosphate phosphatase